MVIITKDIIRKALNESIDEFMINEDALNEKWGDSIKKVGNFLKNAAATYMDWRTGGDWNAKYGIYNNSTGKTTELYYLNQWFNWHVEQIQRLAERNANPNDDSYRERSYKYNDKHEKIYTEVEDNYDSVEKYVNANINAENFNQWIGNRIPNRQAIKVIDDYINEIGQGEQPKIVDVKTANYYLNIGTFQKLKGKNYFASTKDQRETYNKQRLANIDAQKQQAKQQQIDVYKRQINNAKTQIESWSDFIKQMNVDQSGAINTNMGPVHWSKWALSSLYYTNGLPEEIKKWMGETISSNISKSPDEVGKRITYKNFLNSEYGGNYLRIENYLQKLSQTP